jgi:hypothetical protein
MLSKVSGEAMPALMTVISNEKVFAEIRLA